MLRLWVLGSWRAEFNEVPIPRLPTRHARALLARLALAHPRPLARTQLLHVLFPHASLESAASNLRTTLYYLRRTLPNVILSEDALVTLDPSLVIDLDVTRFEQASVSGATQTMLEMAVELYRGPFLQSLANEGWVQDEAERLRRRYVDALQRLIALSDASGNITRMIDAARRWANEEPWNEEASLALVRAYVAGGHRRTAQAQIKVTDALLDEAAQHH